MGSQWFIVVLNFFEVLTSGCQWFLILTSGGSCSEGFPMVLSQFSQYYSVVTNQLFTSNRYIEIYTNAFNDKQQWKVNLENS